jgi:uncharacterized protein YkwD
MRRAAVFVVLGLAVLTAPLSTASPGGVGLQRDAGLEMALVHTINQVRRAHGLRPLRVSPGLRASAVGHSRAMLTNGFFEHDSLDGTRFHDRIRRSYPNRGYETWSVGETLLMSSSDLTVGAAAEAWLASTPHRDILLDSTWRDIGIGVVGSPSAPGVFQDSPAWVVTADVGVRLR